MRRPLRIVILGEYHPEWETHAHTERALVESASHLDLRAEWSWVPSEEISAETVLAHDAFWVATGEPHSNLHNALETIRTAREGGIPCLGTCSGFQHMVLEYARNELGIADAAHAEYDPGAANPLISKLSCSLRGRTMELSLVPGSRVASLYESLTTTERYYCSFGINPNHREVLTGDSFRPVGFDAEGEIRVMEIPDHPFYLGTLFVPQTRSTPAVPHPLISGLLSAAARLAG